MVFVTCTSIMMMIMEWMMIAIMVKVTCTRTLIIMMIMSWIMIAMMVFIFVTCMMMLMIVLVYCDHDCGCRGDDDEDAWLFWRWRQWLLWRWQRWLIIVQGNLRITRSSGQFFFFYLLDQLSFHWDRRKQFVISGGHFMKLVINDNLSFNDKLSDFLDFDWLWSTVTDCCHGSSHWISSCHWWQVLWNGPQISLYWYIFFHCNNKCTPLLFFYISLFM